MKKFSNIINIFIFASLIIIIKSNEDIKTIIPDEKLILKNVKLNKEILLNIDIDKILPSQKYKVMVHYFGSYSISFKISLICDDIYFLKNQKNSQNIQLNDFSEFDFQTNEKKIPLQCSENYDKKKVLLSLIPSSLSYQFINEKDIRFNIIVELITNKYNTDIKPLNILFNKGLYRGLIFMAILVFLIFFVFRNKINEFLIEILELNKTKKNN